MNDQEKRDHVYRWIIAEAWELLREDESEEARNLCSYIEQHGAEALEAWGKQF